MDPTTNAPDEWAGCLQKAREIVWGPDAVFIVAGLLLAVRSSGSLSESPPATATEAVMRREQARELSMLRKRLQSEAGDR